MTVSITMKNYLNLCKEIIDIYYEDHIYLFSLASAAQRGLWPARPRGFLITHNDAQHSVGLLWTSDHLVAETST
jgi:hypothetical protein